MLNNMMENWNKRFANILIHFLKSWSQIMICNHDLRNEIEVLVKHLFSFPVAIFNMMKLLAILEDEAGKTLINSN